MAESRPEYTDNLKRSVYLLRAAGLSCLEISAQIKLDHNGLEVPSRTLQNWCLAAKDLLAQLRDQARALMDERCGALLPGIFEKIEAATRDGDARSVDMYSRAVVNLTREVVREQVEIPHTSTTRRTRSPRC